jgi:hypothetical protein
LQRCPLNSVEQLGQIEDASLFRFAGANCAAAPVAFSTFPGAIGTLEESPGEFRVEPGVEVMSGVVAQIQAGENSSLY